MSLILNRYPITFRKEVIEQILPAVQHGHSVALVGLAGVGKSNLITFLQQPEVLRYYLPATHANRTHLIHIHCLPGDQPAETLFGAIAQRLIEVALRLQLSPPDLPASLDAEHRARLLLNYLCQAQNQRIVLVWDEFDALLSLQPREFPEVLRSLRDEQRATGNLVHMTITHILPQLIRPEESFRLGKFFELLKDHIFPLHAYSRDDSEAMMDSLLRQDSLPESHLNPTIRANFYSLTGGHSGLLKALYDALAPDHSLARMDGRRLVTENSRVRGVCEKIWRHLHRDEQSAVVQLINGGTLSGMAEDYLVRRGLLVKTSPAQPFSRLFAMHVSEQQRT